MTRAVEDTDPEVSPALGAVTQLIQEQVQPPTAAELNEGLRTLFHRIEETERAGERRGARWSSRWSWRAAVAAVCGATAVAAAAAVLVVKTGGTSSVSPRASELAYAVEGGSVVAGGYLRQMGAGRGGVKLSFNEGSQLALMPGARGRLLSVNDGGARMAVEQGTASFRITPSSRHLWLVDVGPFLVTVKGTVFTVSWDAGSERFELRLRRGRVAVSGPISGGDLELRAGQRLVVNLPRAETLITEDAGDDSAPATDSTGTSDVGDSAAVPSPPDAPLAAGKTRQEKSALPAELSPASTLAAVKLRRRAGGGPTTSPAGARMDGPRRWDQAMSGGDWDRILDDVERDGVTATLAGASDEELLALANAARYRRRTDLAREALATERRRFPSSRRALDATYLLGRVEEATAGGRARAVRWYDEYLSRAPSGTYASEALGRKMTLMNELDGPSRARPLAEEYLRRFPGGSYAGSAQALMRAP
jgi:TolA-binding protein